MARQDPRGSVRGAARRLLVLAPAVILASLACAPAAIKASSDAYAGAGSTVAAAGSTVAATRSTVAAAGSAGPAGPSRHAREDLVALIADVGSATAVSYQTRDSTGATVDTIKVIALPGPSRYVGVYQHQHRDGEFSVRLATSTDLLHWTYRATLADHASQPYIAAVPGGGYLVALEQEDTPPRGSIRTDPSHVELRYYASAALLLDGAAARTVQAPNLLSSQHQGTPSITSVTVGPRPRRERRSGPLGDSTIRFGFHYYDAPIHADRNATGTLTDFSSWRERVNTTLDRSFPPTVKGDIGGRDTLTFEGYPFTVVEGQSVPGHFGDFRIYVYDPTARHLQVVHPATAAPGSLAFGNPKLTLLTDPSGQPALLVSLYVFSQHSAPGQAGPLLYYQPL